MALDPPRAALRDALLRHEPLDAVERAHREAVLALVASQPRCFDRTAYAPGHVTGSAFIVCALTGRLLLHHHRRLDRWLQLGGHDEGELDPLHTALREGKEESGLADLRLLSEGILDLDVHEIPPARGEPAHEHHDVRYALVTAEGEAIQRDEAESRDLRWFDLGEAETLMGEPGGSRAIARIRSLLRSR